MTSARMNRRAALGLAGGTALALASSGALARGVRAPQAWDRTVDVLVVGSGFAGLAAAIEARTEGADVLCIEKMSIVGGNSILSGGGLASPGNDLQVAAGIKDSPELLLADMLKSGGGLANVECAKVVAYGALDAYRWAKDFLGVKFDRLGYQGGHSVARSACYMNGNGANMVGPMAKKAKELGVALETRTRLVNLVTDEKGAVVGAELVKGYVFPKEDSGTRMFVHARRGVVVAGGGFSQNVKLRMLHDPRLGPQLESTNQPGATGDAMMAAQRIGAADVQMDWIQLGPWTSPDEQGFGVAPLFVESCVGYGPMIDPATGKRFIKETGNRKVRADAIVAIGHPCVIYTSLENAKNVIIGKNMTPEIYERARKSGVVKEYPTLQAMADDLKIPYEELKKTNDTFNGYMAAKKDPDFDCMFFDNSKPNTDGPFLAVRLWPRVHHCMGGLEINDNAQVLSVRGKVINGLYAAGEVTGGVHGMVRLGTVAVADCMIFGRVAARTAMKFKGC